MTTQDLNPLSYMGIKDKTPPNVRFFTKDPTTADINGFSIGDFWINTTTQTSWQLMSKAAGVATWIAIGGASAQVSALIPDVGLPITPVAGDIAISGSNGIQTSNGGAAIMTVSNTSTVTGDAGGAQPFVAGNLNIVGTVAQGITSTTAAGSVTFTVQDATTAVKGVSSYSSTEFNVAGGAVSLHGGLILIGKTDVVNAPNVSFVIPVSFRNILIVISDFISAVDADTLKMAMSNDGGATWIAAGYEAGTMVNDFDSVVTSNANSVTEFVLSGALDNTAATSTYNGSINVYGCNEPNLPYITGQSCYFRDNTGKTAFGQVFGRGGSTGLNAIDVYFTTGNITSGRISVFGIKES